MSNPVAKGDSSTRCRTISRALQPSSPPTSLREVLRDRAQARNLNSCAPCRERKVRCTRQRPCSACIKRGYPDLCQYPRGSPRGPESPSQRAASARQLPTTPQIQSSPRRTQHVTSTTPRVSELAKESPMSVTLLEGSSLVTLARENDPRSYVDDANRRDALENAVVPLLGGNNIDREEEHRGFSQKDQLEASLSGAEEMLRLFTVYRTRVHSFQPIVDDLNQVETKLCALVNPQNGRGSEQPISSQENLNHRNRFLCLLHAILATGAHFSDLPVSRRGKISQRHVEQVFDLLKECNALLAPFKEALQALLLLGNLLQNNGNPQAAWVLGGTTLRMAICLGIHVRDDLVRHGAIHVDTESATCLRLAVVWQDALLSLAFNRPPASYEMDNESDLPSLNQVAGNTIAGLDYSQAMNWLCHLVLRDWRPASSRPGPLTMDNFTNFFEKIDKIEHSLANHLRSRNDCHSIREMQEHYSLELHKNFTISIFCRPVLSSHACHDLNLSQMSTVLDRLQRALKCSVRAFIRLRSVTSHATRSWAFVHNGLTSALLLGFMKETRNEEESKQIQDELIKSLTKSNELGLESDDEFEDQLSHAHRKSLKALQSLRRLAEDEHRQGNQSGTENTGITATSYVENSFPAFAEDDSSISQDQQLSNFDELFNSFDFNSAFPMEAFDYITSDPVLANMEF